MPAATYEANATGGVIVDTQPKKKTNICAVSKGTPISARAGATTVARIRYAAVVGKPMPRMMAVIIVRISAMSGTPPDIEIIKLDSFDPRPVAERTAEIIPAAAHAIDIGMAFFTPPSASAWA